jgi:CBS domain-containing protein
MNVRDLLERKAAGIVGVSANMPIPEAAGVLTSKGIGAAVVTDQPGRMVGILSERDISRGVSNNAASIVSMKVGDVMTRKVMTCSPDDSVTNVMAIMTANGIRHLPVLEDGVLLGMISMRDAMNEWLAHLREENASLREAVGVAE